MSLCSLAVRSIRLEPAFNQAIYVVCYVREGQTQLSHVVQGFSADYWLEDKLALDNWKLVFRQTRD